MGANTGLIYNKYYEINDKPYTKYKFIKNQNINLLDIPDSIQTLSISGKTTYPGLVFGTGYPKYKYNANKNKKDYIADYAMGFYFDHTTGLPILPGPSIKGALRSVFDNYSEYIIYILEGDKTIANKLNANKKYKNDKKSIVNDLRDSIFDGIYEGKNISMYKRDIFYHAIIGNENDSVFEEDYITPIDNEGEANPIKFLKIKSNVNIKFQFKLNNTVINNKLEEDNIEVSKEDSIEISKEHKLKIFKSIIEDFGVGAKTNIGYGRIKFEKN